MDARQFNVIKKVKESEDSLLFHSMFFYLGGEKD